MEVHIVPWFTVSKKKELSTMNMNNVDICNCVAWRDITRHHVSRVQMSLIQKIYQMMIEFSLQISRINPVYFKSYFQKKIEQNGS